MSIEQAQPPKPSFGQGFVIRAAEPGDVADVVTCVDEAYALYLPRMGRKPAPMTADYGALQRAGALYVGLAERPSGASAGSHIVGMVVLIEKGTDLFLETVAVAPFYQGAGFGRRLIEFAEEEARRRGYCALQLYTNAAMTENLSMYPSLGYRETERRYQDGFDRVFFQKDLSPPNAH